MQRDMPGFIAAVREHRYVFIEGATGLYAVAHCINAVRDVEPIAYRFFEWGLSPRPAVGATGRRSAKDFWAGQHVGAPGVEMNILNLQRFPNALLVLEVDDQPVLVLQNLVPGATRVLDSISFAQLQLLYLLSGNDLDASV